MTGEVILYDLPSKGHCACWSLNPWKTRAGLNYKQIPYKTEWVEYPDVEPKFKSFGIPANEPSLNPMAYSIPAARLPDGRYIMDSRAIADALEEVKPTPSFHLNNGYVEKTQDVVLSIQRPLAPIWMPLVPQNLLNEVSAEYFERTRSERVGMSLSELAKSDKAGETAWKAAEPGLQDLKALLAEKEGPFVAGKEVSYADLVLGGFWIFNKKGGKEEVYERLMAYDASFKQHEEAVSKYFERADH